MDWFFRLPLSWLFVIIVGGRSLGFGGLGFFDGRLVQGVHPPPRIRDFRPFRVLREVKRPPLTAAGEREG